MQEVLLTEPQLPRPTPPPPPALLAGFVLAVLVVVVAGLWLLGPTFGVGVTLLGALALALTLGSPETLPAVLAKLLEWASGAGK